MLTTWKKHDSDLYKIQLLSELKVTMVSRTNYQIINWDFVCWDLFRTPSLSFRFLLQVVTDGLFYKKFIFAIFFTFSTFHQEMHIKYVSFALCPIPVLLIKDDSAQSCLQSVCTRIHRVKWVCQKQTNNDLLRTALYASWQLFVWSLFRPKQLHISGLNCPSIQVDWM